MINIFKKYGADTNIKKHDKHIIKMTNIYIQNKSKQKKKQLFKKIMII